MNEKGFFTKSQTSEYSGIAQRTLDAARARGDLPFIKFSSRKILFRKCDVDHWLNSMLVDARNAIEASSGGAQ